MMYKVLEGAQKCGKLRTFLEAKGIMYYIGVFPYRVLPIRLRTSFYLNSSKTDKKVIIVLVFTNESGRSC